MKKLLVALAVAGILTVASFSRHDTGESLKIDRENRNPWTNAPLNNAPETFQFAIVSDRTGGHRAKIFSRAVDRLNLLQPEFVVSVGDLIEGGRKPAEQIQGEWKEFDSYVNKLSMPFFYVPGNHDVGNVDTDKVWQQRLGRRHYHFVYKNVLFLCLNTDDPPGAGAGNLTKEQVDYAKKALADNVGVRWTLVFLHKPIWTAGDLPRRGWLDVEKALADRPYTVFCGHVHRYRKFLRQGREYYQLATTGGGSRLRGQAYGEFDHLVWVTMKKEGPVLTNIMLDSILTDDLKVPESTEEGVKLPVFQTYPIKGIVYYEGSPLAGAYVTLSTTLENGKRTFRTDSITEGDGSFTGSTYKTNDGLPAGKYAVTVVLRRPFLKPDGTPGPNLLAEKYAKADTSGLSIEVKSEGTNSFILELTR